MSGDSTREPEPGARQSGGLWFVSGVWSGQFSEAATQGRDRQEFLDFDDSRDAGGHRFGVIGVVQVADGPTQHDDASVDLDLDREVRRRGILTKLLPHGFGDRLVTELTIARPGMATSSVELVAKPPRIWV